MSCGTQVLSTARVTFTYRAVTLSGRPFQAVPLQRTESAIESPTTPTQACVHRFRLFPFRSPLLGESLLISFPAGTEMFHFPAFAHSPMNSAEITRFTLVGCPIRKSPDRSLLAAPRSLSQLSTSFIASLSPRHPPCALRSLTVSLRHGISLNLEIRIRLQNPLHLIFKSGDHEGSTSLSTLIR